MEIRLYVTENGKVPFSEWIDSLKDKTSRQLIKARIERIRLGNFGDCKSLRGEIFELRIKFGPGYRVYFGKEGDKVVILLIGGDKSSQQKDILKARKFWQDYKERKND